MIDWFWSLDAYRNTPDYVRNFGDGNAKFHAILIIGRDKFATGKAELANRLDWRHKHISMRGSQIQCITFDQLYEFYLTRLTFLRGIADRGDLQR